VRGGGFLAGDELSEDGAEQGRGKRNREGWGRGGLATETVSEPKK